VRHFLFAAPGCSRKEIGAWEDVGFKLTVTDIDNLDEQRPDVIVWRRQQADKTTMWQMVNSLLPKVFVIVCADDKEMTWPESLVEIYDSQAIFGESFCFNVGSKIQGKVAVPDWDANRTGGQLSQEDEIKALAGSIYRYLLEDVFRETAEWCGHMSSVVGPA